MSELTRFNRISRSLRCPKKRAITSSLTWNDAKSALEEAIKYPSNESQTELALETISGMRRGCKRACNDGIILGVLELLRIQKSNSSLCEKAFEALDVFDYQHSSHGFINLVCNGLVHAIGDRLLLDYEAANEVEYDNNFCGNIPCQLLGNEGIWRMIFSYHYCSLDDNFEVLMKGFIIANTIAYYHPNELGLSIANAIAKILILHILLMILLLLFNFLILLSIKISAVLPATLGIAHHLVKMGTTFPDRVDFAELGSQTMTHLVCVDWQYSLTSDRSRLVDAGFCEYCMSMMKTHLENTQVICHCLEVIHNLTQCSISEIQMKLVEEGAVERIVEAVKHNCLSDGKFNITIAYSAIMATNALTDRYGNDPEVISNIVALFVNCGMCEIIVRILEKYAPGAEIKYDWQELEGDDEGSILDSGQAVIRNLAAHNEGNRRRLTLLGAGNWLPELF